VSRLRELQVDERPALDGLLDEMRIGHIGFDAGEGPVVIPTAIVRILDSVVVHGSTGSRWMRSVAEGVPACLAVTSLDGMIVARSAFESSFRYRSAVIFGRFERLEGDTKRIALDAVVDKLVPGRLSEVRPSTTAERNKTLVLALPIEQWSLKVSAGWPEDGPEDVDGPAWAGVVPFGLRAGPALPAPDAGLWSSSPGSSAWRRSWQRWATGCTCSR